MALHGFLLAVLDDDEDCHDLIESDDDTFVLAVGSTVMRRSLSRIQGYFEETVPSYFGDEFKSHFRLTRNTCELLTREIVASGYLNVGLNRFGRTPIPPEKQILIYLWMLANGSETSRQVADRFDVTMSSCGRVLRKVNTAILSILPRYLKWPNVAEMREISQSFEDGGMPGTIGAIDGTFIKIKAPGVDSESYICRKKFYALQLQIVCDNNMVLTDVLAGWPGSVHDSRVLRNSSLFATSGNKFPADYHIIGDGGYPLMRWLMTPFRNNGHLQPNQLHFNNTLSSSRQIVERAISLLKGRWRKLGHLNHLSVKLMTKIVMGACVLHNVTLIHDDFDESYFLDDDDDDDDDDDNDDNVHDGNCRDRTAELKRQHLSNIISG